MVFFNSCDSVDFHYALLSQGSMPPIGPAAAGAAAGTARGGSARAGVRGAHQPTDYESDFDDDGGLDDAAAAPLVPGQVLKLHGDMPQQERTSSFLSFVKVRERMKEGVGEGRQGGGWVEGWDTGWCGCHLSCIVGLLVDGREGTYTGAMSY